MPLYVKIGKIINTHGYKGELKVLPLTDEVDRFFDLHHVFIDDDEYHVIKARLHQEYVLLLLQGREDMDSAKELQGSYLELPVEELKKLPEGQYYHFQIVGLSVYEDNRLLGEVSDILQTGSNDVYVVKSPKGKEIYLPALKEVVRHIDVEAGKIEVKLPPGLLD